MLCAEFCTEWPAGLETDEACQKHFPVEVQSSDFVFSGPSIRDPRARNVTVRVSYSGHSGVGCGKLFHPQWCGMLQVHGL